MANVVPRSLILVTLMMEALRSSKTSVLTRATQCNIPEDAIFHRLVINIKGSSHSGREEKHLKGVSEKFRLVENQYSIVLIFRTKHTFRNSLMKPVQKRSATDDTYCPPLREMIGSVIGRPSGSHSSNGMAEM
jgi:hypothetical protein